MVAFTITGILVSAYLTYLSLLPPTSCPIGSFAFFSCNEVIYSAYSKFFGVSVALLGLGWFIIAFGLIALARRSQRFMHGVLAWSLLGAVGVAGFVYTELFLIGSICPLCTVAHLMGIAVLALSIVATLHRTPSTEA